MAKVTSKLQVTIPRSIARAHRIQPGTQVEFESTGDSIRVREVSPGETPQGDDPAWRLKLFREATHRQELRDRRYRRASRRPAEDRGWRREDLYTRGSPR